VTEEPCENMTGIEDQGISTADLAGKSAPPAPDRGGDFDEGTSSLITPPPQAAEDQAAPLLSGQEADELHRRWDMIQAGFVDEPRSAVEQADSLVAGTMKRLAEMFAEERSRLESQWDRGDDVSTEDLRIALRRYRSFFGRLLSM
jgi:hypothetical protein